MLSFDQAKALNEFRLLQQNERDALSRDVIKKVSTPQDKRLGKEIATEFYGMGESTGLEVLLAIGLLFCQELE